MVTITSLQWASACRVWVGVAVLASERIGTGCLGLVGGAERDDDDLVLGGQLGGEVARPCRLTIHGRDDRRGRGHQDAPAPGEQAVEIQATADQPGRGERVGRLDGVGEGIAEQAEDLGVGPLARRLDPSAIERRARAAHGGSRRSRSSGARASLDTCTVGSTSGSTRDPGSRRPGVSLPSSVARRAARSVANANAVSRCSLPRFLKRQNKRIALEQVLAVPRPQTGLLVEAAVPDGGARLVADALARQPQAPAQVDVLSHRGEALVEATYRLERRRGDDEPGPTRPQHVAGAVHPCARRERPRR